MSIVGIERDRSVNLDSGRLVTLTKDVDATENNVCPRVELVER